MLIGTGRALAREDLFHRPRVHILRRITRITSMGDIIRAGDIIRVWDIILGRYSASYTMGSGQGSGSGLGEAVAEGFAGRAIAGS